MLAVLVRDPDKPWSSGFIFLVKVAIASPATCHGFIRYRLLPQYGNFLEMVMNILPINETGCHFLNTAGALDFLLSIAFSFLGAGRWYIVYASFWGTSIARVWAYFHWAFWDSVLKQWLHESVMRFPHFWCRWHCLSISRSNRTTPGEN